MSSTSFVVTPTLYQRYFPQERKSQQSLFWFGLGVNIFFGNVVAITQQALWGRALDYAGAPPGGGRPVDYRAVVGDGLKKEGVAAFFTPSKWFARVLMNAPIQGTVSWSRSSNPRLPRCSSRLRVGHRCRGSTTRSCRSARAPCCARSATSLARAPRRWRC